MFDFVLIKDTYCTLLLTGKKIVAQPLDTNVSAGASALRSPRGRQMGADWGCGWHSQVPLLGEMTYKIGSTFRSSTRHGHGATRQ